MERRKILKLLATVFGVFSLSLGTAACSFNTTPETPEQEETEDSRIRKIYELAVAAGATTLTYEEWIASIRGENGQDGRDGNDGVDGLTPYIGTNGNWWIGSTDTGVHARGPQGDPGEDGQDGADGADGKDGLDGKDGKDGKDGQNGQPGSSLLSGNGVPSNSLGNDGDSYIDTSNWDFYNKINGVWVKSGNIKGADGSDGAPGTPGTPGQNGEDGHDGQDGQDGNDGLSAYQIYLKYHPEYTKSEAEWLDDLINGRLGTQQIHTVTFDSRGGTPVSTQQVLHGEKAVKPISPTKEGFNFKDWVDENGDHWVFNGFSITSDITLYATWEVAEAGHVHTYNESWSYNNEQHYHAATCGHDVVADAANHTFSDVVTPATYEHGGYTTHTCTVCGYTYTDSETAQLVHYSITVGAQKTSLVTGESTNLTIKSNPSINFDEAFSKGDLQVHNDNSSVIEINAYNGTAKAVGVGTAHVYVTYLGVDNSNVIEFTVTDPAPTPAEPVNVTFFAFNDLHGAVLESNTTAGISKTATYLKQKAALTPEDDTVVISQGDMFQGSFESNSNEGKLITEWMNECNFVSMTYGNHEYDWGIGNLVNAGGAKDTAQFPFLAINIMYSSGRNAGERATYADASTVITRNGVKIGIIGAIGNCKTSIEADLVEDVYFATGNELTNLVKSESTRLRDEEGCDFIVYSLHSATMRSDDKLKTDPYDITLSSGGYVDVVFESHTHDQYCLQDSAGIYHMQGSSYGKGLYEFSVNITPNSHEFSVNYAEYVETATPEFKSLSTDTNTDYLINNKYYDASAYQSLGYNSEARSSEFLRQIIADEYVRLGKAKRSSYDIFLGGGYISIRNPNVLYTGAVTYAKLYELFPFDNRICLCSIKGDALKTRFMRNTSAQASFYFIGYGEGHSDSDYNSINESATYYIVTDTYSAYFDANECTIIDFYEPQNYYARDILRQYALDGHFDTGSSGGDQPYELVGDGSIANPYTVTDTSHEAAQHPSSSALFGYYKGRIKEIPDPINYSSHAITNITLTDGTTDLNIGRLFRTDGGAYFGNAFDNLSTDIEVGDEIVFAGASYNNGSVTYSGGNVVVSINGVPLSGRSVDDPMTVKQLRLGQCGEPGTAYYNYLANGNKIYLTGTVSNLNSNADSYSFTLGSEESDLNNGRWATDAYGKYLSMSEVTLEGDADASTLENDATIVVSYDGNDYKIVKTPEAHGKSAADPLSAAEAYAIGSSGDNYYVKGAVSKITTPYNSAYGNMSFDVDCGDGTLLRFYNASVTEEQATLFATKGAIAIGFGKLAIYGAIHEINGTTIVDGYMPTTHSIIEVSGSSSVFVGGTTQLSAKSYPESLGEPGSYTRSTSDANIATVGDNGLVTGVSEGEVQITVSNGSISKIYTVLVSANTHGLIESDPLSAEEANEIAAGLPTGTSTTSFYYIEGVVTRVTSAWSSQYGNITFYIQIGTGSEEFYVYRCYCDEATGTAIQAGTRVLIYSKLQNYRGTPETVQAGSNCVIIG